jgi:D-3-phosphoglycerate dehydrogenase
MAAGRLQWIQSSAAGMDHCLVPSVIESDIPVTSASAVLADQVAEHTLALLTAFCRCLPRFFKATQAREFIRRPTRDLTRSTVGIVGFGGVGRRVAEVLRPLKTRILATDMFPGNKPDYVEALWPAEQLDDLLAQSDFVVLSLPLNEMTRGILDGAKLDLMQPHAVLANMARGPLVVTDHLVDRLRRERIAGAVMDVTDPEPLTEDHPLWALPNVIVTPHVAGQSRWRIDNMTMLFCENLRRWQSGEPLINYLTDKRLGFPVRGVGYPLWTDVVDLIRAGQSS